MPLTYAAIAKHPSVVNIYKDKLIKENVITNEEFENQRRVWKAEFDKEHEISKSYVANPMEWLASNWQVCYVIFISQWEVGKRAAFRVKRLAV
jgi:2-oxoglutarate dehydrogenase E1 component